MLLEISLLYIFLYQPLKRQAFALGPIFLLNFKLPAFDPYLWPLPIPSATLTVIVTVFIFVESTAFDLLQLCSIVNFAKPLF